ncbi:F-box/kelch-repeat protein At3g23880-like [Silene latifolia]|uniref:F-box/kelch-repeat protein At3g23880-like n=1 Tax=Silene latifolia TaxID=37657 RepID=UPI003D76C793
MSDVNPYISQDIWFEIFKELPVKILGKCRCVCKSWHSLIVSPTFMAAHLNHYTQNDANSLLLYRKISLNISQHEQYCFFLDSGRIPLQLSHTSICPFNVFYDSQHCSFFVGSINGLICLSDDGYLGPTIQIMLWNPFLRKTINLPLSMAATIDLDDQTSVLGFGYDSKKNDHRVVKISYSRGNHEFNPLVEVYSVWDRIWRNIPSDYLVGHSIPMVSSSQCFINGVVYWLTSENYVIDNSSFGKWIVSFDIVEETFEKIELPNKILNSWKGEFGILEYKTKLSLSHCEYQRDMDAMVIGAIVHIWVKEEKSWCLILNIAINDYIHMGPIDYLGRNGELFGFARATDKMLILCDILMTKTRLRFTLGIRHFVMKEFLELGLHQDASTKFAAFTESLVLLDDQNTDVCTNDALKSIPYIHST